jgi:hypothetical protein
MKFCKASLSNKNNQPVTLSGEPPLSPASMGIARLYYALRYMPKYDNGLDATEKPAKSHGYWGFVGSSAFQGLQICGHQSRRGDRREGSFRQIVDCMNFSWLEKWW